MTWAGGPAFLLGGFAMTIALVTGTSSGIGLATSVSLARHGHKVIATMRDLNRSTELRKIAEAESLPISFGQLDVNSDISVNDSMSRLLSEHDHIDVLVNNAGRIFSRGHGDQLLWRIALHKGLDPKHARASQRLHYQRDFDRREDGHCASGVLCSLQVGA
jgi:NAD(P)-dependent dehydrogenase (short-subunit alcohol dehydrogenase family)